jgi:hypothetical protein
MFETPGNEQPKSDKAANFIKAANAYSPTQTEAILETGAEVLRTLLPSTATQADINHLLAATIAVIVQQLHDTGEHSKMVAKAAQLAVQGLMQQIKDLEARLASKP